MKNIVVTGATGFIGSYLVHELLMDEENHVIAVIRENSKNKSKLELHPNLETVECSMEHISNLPKFIQKDIDIFYHLAWDGIRNEDRENIQIQKNNYLNSIQALIVAKKMKATRFIGIGSQAEYGGSGGKITEESPTNPTSEYGKAKLQFFKDGLSISQYLGINFVWGRVFSAYGYGDYEDSLISYLIRNLKNNHPVYLSNSKQKWDYIHVSDVASALVSLKCANAGVYNISGGDIRELKQYVLEIVNIMNSSSKLNIINCSNEPNIVSHGFEPDITRIKNECGWKPTVKFSDGINRLLCDK